MSACYDVGAMKAIDLAARDITGVAKAQRRRNTRFLILGVVLLTLIFVWFTV